MERTIPPKKTMSDLLEVMAALRAPDTGCPWDVDQTFETIAPYTLEEAYEVADAIARRDMVDLRDELGDLLLQVVYHARMAEEQNAFDFADVVNAITTKMIRRHPHVFGTPEERAAGPKKGAWDRIKAEEKQEKARIKKLNASPAPDDDANHTGSLLSDIPLALPALTQATKLQHKAARVGFDWPCLGPVFEKMKEELQELEAVATPADPRSTTQDVNEQTRNQIFEEYGDLLFVMANVARHLKLNPEAALRAANGKFKRRFAHIEHRLASKGKTPAQSDLAEMDELWNEAKDLEKSRGSNTR